MLKKVVSLMMVALMAATVMCTSTFAAPGKDVSGTVVCEKSSAVKSGIIDKLGKAMEKADKEIDKATKKADDKKGKKDGKAEDAIIKLVEKSNKQIAKLVEKAIKNGDKITDEEIEILVTQINLIAMSVIDAAEKAGVTVECEYVMVEINGQIVMIDPLRVIRA